LVIRDFTYPVKRYTCRLEGEYEAWCGMQGTTTRSFINLLVLLIFLAGCSVNPVTGDRELVLVSDSQAIQMGEQNYAPMQQSQGGVYDVDPALTQYVQNVGNKLAAVSDAPLPYEFVVLNNSVPNAWALPGGKIAINRGLLTELESEAELAAVLGHEIVHAAARHTARQQTRSMWMQGLVVATAVVTSDSNYGNMALAGAGAAAQLATMKYGRSAELESDKYGIRYMYKAGYDPQGAVALQETFMRLSEGHEQDWISGLFSSHPPSEERVQENIKTAAKLPPGGVIGVDSYRAAMAQTLEAKLAYDTYDEGRKALADEDNDKALSLANKALDLFSAEANFHALRGDVRLIEDKYDMAVTNYNRAINRRGDFFYYHLQRGIAKNELGQSDAAVVDLERSIALLPTAPAHYVLGEIAANRGDTTKAIEHYQVVANSGGDIGNAAATELVRLDLPSNPGAYVASACGDDGSGEVIISVRNDTPVALAGIEAVVTFVDSGGNQRRIAQIFSGQVEPGKIKSVATGIVPAPDSTCTTEVTSARIVD
jgi:predicted Zn-dependent protease